MDVGSQTCVVSRDVANCNSIVTKIFTSKHKPLHFRNGNPFIYEILDWSQSKRSSIIVAASMVGLIIVYAFIWGIALCRDKVSTYLVRTTSHDLPAAPPDRHTRIV